jgi:plasmid stabilization system protein ParE
LGTETPPAHRTAFEPQHTLIAYSVKPKTDRDLDEYADHLVEEANLDVALRFLSCAYETFDLLSTQRNMGWRSRLKQDALKSLPIFRVKDFEHMLILYRPLATGSTSSELCAAHEICKHSSGAGARSTEGDFAD